MASTNLVELREELIATAELFAHEGAAAVVDGVLSRLTQVSPSRTLADELRELGWMYEDTDTGTIVWRQVLGKVSGGHDDA